MGTLLMTLILLGTGEMFAVSRDDLQGVAERFIRERLARPAQEIVVEFRSVPDRIEVHEQGSVARVAPSVVSVFPGNVTLPIEVTVNGRVDRRCFVSVKVRTFDSVLVTCLQVSRHDRLGPESVRKERVETTMLRALPVKDVDQLGSRRAVRILSAGTVLTDDLLEGIPEVTQGSLVTLLIKAKGVRLSVEAVAREDGKKGGRVMVQRVGSDVRLQAVVLDPKTVEMTIHE